MKNEPWSEYRHFEPITDKRHPRVWLRLLIRKTSAWLDKPTKAEAAHADAWLAGFNAWLALGDSGEQARHSAVCAMEGDAATCSCQRPISSDSSSCDPGLGAH